MKSSAKNSFKLLCNRKIIAILDGDSDFGEMPIDNSNKPIKISFPYLSGRDLCDLSNCFGLPASYSWGGGAQSRWSYLEDLMKYCIENNKISDLLGHLFSVEQFSNEFKNLPSTIIKEAHTKIVTEIISQINGILFFSGHELVILLNRFEIRKIGDTISIAAPAVKTVDRAYITDLSDRAMKDVSDGYYDSAVTKSRTLLEEVFCYVIEKKHDTPSDSGDIGKLYNQVKQLYNMHQNKDADKRINNLLSGFEKIITSIAQMRNKDSDSHGLGSRRINIAEHHARLFVNSAMTMADFVLAVAEKNE